MRTPRPSSTNGSEMPSQAMFPNSGARPRRSEETATAYSRTGHPGEGTTRGRRGSKGRSEVCWRRHTASTTTSSSACGYSTSAKRSRSRTDADYASSRRFSGGVPGRPRAPPKRKRGIRPGRSDARKRFSTNCSRAGISRTDRRSTC